MFRDKNFETFLKILNGEYGIVCTYIRGQTEPSGNEDKESNCHKVSVRQETNKDILLLEKKIASLYTFPSFAKQTTSRQPGR